MNLPPDANGTLRYAQRIGVRWLAIVLAFASRSGVFWKLSALRAFLDN